MYKNIKSLSCTPENNKSIILQLKTSVIKTTLTFFFRVLYSFLSKSSSPSLKSLRFSPVLFVFVYLFQNLIMLITTALQCILKLKIWVPQFCCLPTHLLSILDSLCFNTDFWKVLPIFKIYACQNFIGNFFACRLI